MFLQADWGDSDVHLRMHMLILTASLYTRKIWIKYLFSF